MAGQSSQQSIPSRAQAMVQAASSQQLGFLIVLISSTGYALLPIFTRAIYAASTLKPTDIALWRYFFGVPIIWLLIATRSSLIATRSSLMRSTTSPAAPATPITPSVGALLLLGALYAGAALSAFAGLELIAASVYVVLFFTYPTMVALISALTGTRLSARAWLAVGFTLIGIILTIPDFRSLQGANLSGVLIALLNALLVALYFLASGRLMRGITSMSRGTAWIMTNTLLCLLVLLPMFGVQMPQNATTWLLLLGLSIFATALPIFFLNIGIQMIGAPKTAIISSIEPVITMILALILLDEIILPTQWVGAVAIIAAVILLEYRPRRKP